MKAFQDGKTLIELAALFMVVLPMMLYVVLGMKVNWGKKKNIDTKGA